MPCLRENVAARTHLQTSRAAHPATWSMNMCILVHNPEYMPALSSRSSADQACRTGPPQTLTGIPRSWPHPNFFVWTAKHLSIDISPTLFLMILAAHSEALDCVLGGIATPPPLPKIRCRPPAQCDLCLIVGSHPLASESTETKFQGRCRGFTTRGGLGRLGSSLWTKK